MRYKDIFIDFDDTIYDTHGNAQIALGELFGDFALERYFDRVEDFTEPYWKANVQLWGEYGRGEITRDYLIAERFRRPLAEGHGLNPTVEYCLKVSDHFLELCSCKPGILPGARQLLDYLQPRYRLHLCSNGFHEVQYKKLAASDTARYFQNIILSEDAGANKPSAKFFDYAFKQTGADPKTTLMIGDNLQSDIIGAHEYGLDTIHFNRWDEPHHPAATYQANHLEDIITLLENN